MATAFGKNTGIVRAWGKPLTTIELKVYLRLFTAAIGKSLLNWGVLLGDGGAVRVGGGDECEKNECRK